MSRRVVIAMVGLVAEEGENEESKCEEAETVGKAGEVLADVLRTVLPGTPSCVDGLGGSETSVFGGNGARTDCDSVSGGRIFGSSLTNCSSSLFGGLATKSEKSNAGRPSSPSTNAEAGRVSFSGASTAVATPSVFFGGFLPDAPTFGGETVDPVATANDSAGCPASEDTTSCSEITPLDVSEGSRVISPFGRAAPGTPLFGKTTNGPTVSPSSEFLDLEATPEITSSVSIGSPPSGAGLDEPSGESKGNEAACADGSSSGATSSIFGGSCTNTANRSFEESSGGGSLFGELPGGATFSVGARDDIGSGSPPGEQQPLCKRPLLRSRPQRKSVISRKAFAISSGSPSKTSSKRNSQKRLESPRYASLYPAGELHGFKDIAHWYAAADIGSLDRISATKAICKEFRALRNEGTWKSSPQPAIAPTFRWAHLDNGGAVQVFDCGPTRARMEARSYPCLVTFFVDVMYSAVRASAADYQGDKQWWIAGILDAISRQPQLENPELDNVWRDLTAWTWQLVDTATVNYLDHVSFERHLERCDEYLAELREQFVEPVTGRVSMEIATPWYLPPGTKWRSALTEMKDQGRTLNAARRRLRNGWDQFVFSRVFKVKGKKKPKPPGGAKRCKSFAISPLESGEGGLLAVEGSRRRSGVGGEDEDSDRYIGDISSSPAAADSSDGPVRPASAGEERRSVLAIVVDEAGLDTWADCAELQDPLFIGNAEEIPSTDASETTHADLPLCEVNPVSDGVVATLTSETCRSDSVELGISTHSALGSCVEEELGGWRGEPAQNSSTGPAELVIAEKGTLLQNVLIIETRENVQRADKKSLVADSSIAELTCLLDEIEASGQDLSTSVLEGKRRISDVEVIEEVCLERNAVSTKQPEEDELAAAVRSIAGFGGDSGTTAKPNSSGVEVSELLVIPPPPSLKDLIAEGNAQTIIAEVEGLVGSGSGDPDVISIEETEGEDISEATVSSEDPGSHSIPESVTLMLGERPNEEEVELLMLPLPPSTGILRTEGNEGLCQAEERSMETESSPVLLLSGSTCEADPSSSAEEADCSRRPEEHEAVHREALPESEAQRWAILLEQILGNEIASAVDNGETSNTDRPISSSSEPYAEATLASAVFEAVVSREQRLETEAQPTYVFDDSERGRSDSTDYLVCHETFSNGAEPQEVAFSATCGSGDEDIWIVDEVTLPSSSGEEVEVVFSGKGPEPVAPSPLLRPLVAQEQQRFQTVKESSNPANHSNRGRHLRQTCTEAEIAAAVCSISDWNFGVVEENNVSSPKVSGENETASRLKKTQPGQQNRLRPTVPDDRSCDNGNHPLKGLELRIIDVRSVEPSSVAAGSHDEVVLEKNSETASLFMVRPEISTNVPVKRGQKRSAAGIVVSEVTSDRQQAVPGLNSTDGGSPPSLCSEDSLHGLSKKARLSEMLGVHYPQRLKTVFDMANQHRTLFPSHLMYFDRLELHVKMSHELTRVGDLREVPLVILDERCLWHLGNLFEAYLNKFVDTLEPDFQEEMETCVEAVQLLLEESHIIASFFDSWFKSTKGNSINPTT